jgi:tRNA nucleotidyltransferase (CCA-adding enzyme)
MKVIFGHSNMDLDCFGSLVLASKLFPDHRLVKSSVMHPAAKSLYNLYADQLNFMDPSDLDGEEIERVVVVDTRSLGRVREYFDHMPDFQGEIEVFDHHPADSNDIPRAYVHESDFGSNTTHVGIEVMRVGISLTPDEATIALAGIYADTGNFTHENVKPEDFLVSNFLLDQGASVKLVRTFIQTLKGGNEISLFHDLLNRLTYRTVNGQFITLSYLELPKQTGGLAMIVEKAFEVESPDAIFCVFHFKKENDTIIIARSQKETISLDRILEPFGGGGHVMASSALIKNSSGRLIFESLEKSLESSVLPAVCAEEIMMKGVHVIEEGWDLMRAAIFLETINHTGAPVVNGKGDLCGFITLRNIMKGRKAGEMKAPVRSYMTTKIITAARTTTIREVESLLFSNNIGHLPVVEGKSIVGIITRADYVEFVKERRRFFRAVIEKEGEAIA